MNFDTYIDQRAEDIIKTTQEIIRIPSVKGPAQPGKPFGEDTYRALEYMLALGNSMGFRTKNLDGYIGYIEFGEGTEMVGILAHLDVVPPGGNWTYPPFAAEIHDGKIYGRGAIDDKGPAVAALYAMKALKDSGVPLNKRIRLILGLDEESGWECIQRYKETEEAPSLGFTPDADYPVIHAEKGIVHYKIFKQVEGNLPVRLIQLKGGDRPNIVPDYCEAVIEATPDIRDQVHDYLKKATDAPDLQVELCREENTLTLKAHGKSAHGSTPEKGINAISKIISLLHSCMKNFNISHPFIDFYMDCIGTETDGKSIGCLLEDSVSGKLTLNVGIASMDTSHAEIVIDIRYPVTFKEEDIYERIYPVVQRHGACIEKINEQSPLYVPKDHPLVQKLMKVYEDVTGEHREPLSIGGGTYARAFDNTVAFGATFPGEPELAHQTDEYILIDSLIRNAKIFARAIHALA
ncbi:MAG: dipeptidase PepV [Clostridiaceae bacterium]|nr:dipeptidase PepV [Clostridiaceae bacterium]